MNAVDALFLDTNVLVYGHDRGEAVKGPAAASLVNRLFAVGWPIVMTPISLG